MANNPNKSTDYDRVVFTKEMKKNYTILIPDMIEPHFKLLSQIFHLYGYKVKLLQTTHAGIAQEGLRSVHNDTCYPALLVIGQLVDAIKNGGYDPDKIAVMITQTGGGCRASNYIHLLRKALKHNHLEHIPVISLNVSGLEKNPGFKLSLPLVAKLLYTLAYGDILMWLGNQVRPYENHPGQTDQLINTWVDRLTEEFKSIINTRGSRIRKNLGEIVRDFEAIPKTVVKKKRVGVVGEIYIKYAPLGNNNLEAFLANEGCEVVVPGIMDFMIFKTDNRMEDIKLYGGSKAKFIVVKFFKNFLMKIQGDMIKAIKENSKTLRPVSTYHELKNLVEDYLGYGNKMGEGWLLTAEMLELNHMGAHNIVCAQPFGCLPNHIVGKGMIRKIKENHPEANIVAIDYDPGATRVNQENRIKLMLANAQEV